MGVLLLMEEIRRSPVEVGSLSHYLQGFSTIQSVVGLGISEPSTVGPYNYIEHPLSEGNCRFLLVALQDNDILSSSHVWWEGLFVAHGCGTFRVFLRDLFQNWQHDCIPWIMNLSNEISLPWVMSSFKCESIFLTGTPLRLINSVNPVSCFSRYFPATIWFSAPFWPTFPSTFQHLSGLA